MKISVRTLFTQVLWILLGVSIVFSLFQAPLSAFAQNSNNTNTQNSTTQSTQTASTSQFQDPEACRIRSKITMTDILAPATFIPVIPEDCSTTPDGKPQPLSLGVAGDIAIRFFGALASLVFYLFFFVALFSGILWIYGGIDGGQATQAKRNFQDSFLGLVLVLSVYVIVNTLMVVLQVQLPSTDLTSFFSVG